MGRLGICGIIVTDFGLEFDYDYVGQLILQVGFLH